ncbi:MAG: Holliday junction DNA helicase RuvB [Candidatus Liptonbacteria bacterium RIFCSPLOWO2_01_FULL_52_25]|uniref:Holliday junction branch migration complex subunit RuvB n=1 Tax=Candidatus Liptonbacteria bacterium RIFCSPLOWO2_01_FULL_52_25 TaxID=1798650 RepID=A0A1G2CEH7_9BACT|nr:MAG: Holliday junction DNA helicase RuvB [Candidatus Liptonbacteria bacterium RIFCSPLOWO2_01_FULL_52_25]
MKTARVTTKEDQSIDQALRPVVWHEYVGQEKIKSNLRVLIDAAKKRGESADHMLFSGPAGLGKTTLAYLVAHELNSSVRTTSGPALEKAGDLAAILTNLEPGEILFIDEAHRVNPIIEEVLYPAMESRKLHLVVGKGPSARTLSLDLPPFTLIAATTRENLLSQPLRSRFGATLRLNFYNREDIKKILARSSKLLGIKIVPEAVEILAKASRGTPRIANRLLKRARDYAEVGEKDTIDEIVVRKALEMLEIDEVGLEPQDRRLIDVIIKKFNGGPVGINTLSAALSEEKGVIEDIYEPYLMTLGFLQRSSAGRIVLPPAYEHLGHKRPSELL